MSESTLLKIPTVSTKNKCLCCERELKSVPTKLGWVNIRFGEGICFDCIEFLNSAMTQVKEVEKKYKSREVRK